MQKPSIPKGYVGTASGVIPSDWEGEAVVLFDDLANLILSTHQLAQQTAHRVVDQSATLRNWLIGYYIVEFEQKGEDRAAYGTQLLKKLERKLATRGLNETLFKLARQFYLLYPSIKKVWEKSATLSHELPQSEIKKSATVSHEYATPPEYLISTLSFSHIRELMTIDCKEERFFYEKECINCSWSVRELRRQIATNLYFRCGVSENPRQLLETRNDAPALTNAIKEPFTFEFLGLTAVEAMNEKDLENALIANLRSFLLELGKGFCFEAQQQRLIIDGRYYFTDLVFYHRILHCNVIIELKNDEFKHEYLGQLNSYVAYYKKHEMYEGDNPPIGILLCTRKGSEMVEYALAGMDNNLFVSTYQLQLPDKDLLKNFIRKTI